MQADLAVILAPMGYPAVAVAVAVPVQLFATVPEFWLLLAVVAVVAVDGTVLPVVNREVVQELPLEVPVPVTPMMAVAVVVVAVVTMVGQAAHYPAEMKVLIQETMVPI
jgi:hypothetical protein